MTIELNEQEQNTLVQLLDVAVKASGLAGAEAALYFVNKLKHTQTPVKAESAKEEINE